VVLIGRFFLQVTQPSPLMVVPARVVLQQLQVYSTQLSAAGYPLDAPAEQLQQLLRTLQAFAADQQHQGDPAAASSSSAGHPSSTNSGNAVAAADPVATASTSSSMSEALGAVQQQLRQTGLALCCMAVPCLCNNTGCTNTGGPTELSLVSGRSCVWGLPSGPLLLPGLSVPALEAAQARVHCTGRCRHRSSSGQHELQLILSVLLLLRSAAVQLQGQMLLSLSSIVVQYSMV
jgi:hypothetical protein